ncbi:P-loop containing nucleoside triphosphate hydrolase protein [Lentinus tigrinus ALCF2SS1-6]|uniref:RNA helicase n=1 Tax=Lentinus tigrinus ALCF2SS1-6 TaxID=1328759 RepID=A0A5C2SM03_9APHY|nr:P-loop containing nucleoside triphosphate hydrolase protein [Lentinus tigrinus ALCF2SS1-6]
MQSLSSAVWTNWTQLARRACRARHLHSSISRHSFKGPRDTVTSHPHPDEYSFERLRLKPDVLAALRLAFPSIKHPTPIQHRFIDAVLKGKDVLLKDSTGTGKSFALALALLSKGRGPPYKKDDGSRTLPITSLLLVPHRDLAYQLYHWIERIHHHMTRRESLPSLAQVLVRDSSATLEEHLAPIRKAAPHILIGTPQMVYDVVQADPHALPLDRLSTIVVDEADYLIPSVPVIPDKFLMMKIERQVNRHPGPTRLLLNQIYSATSARRNRRRDDRKRLPQLVMMSATLRNHLKRFLLADSGWFTQEPGKLVRITGDASAYYPRDLKNSSAENHATFALGGTGIQHHVLVVSEQGNVANIEGAAKRSEPTPEEESKPSPGSSSAPAQLPSHSVAPDVEEIDEPSPFNADVMEAIAASFALDVPSVALLVLPADAPVQRAVYDLRLLGVNARPLDVVKDENGKTHLMRRDFGATAENPTLLVSTLASTRGLDLPELSHVFILGVLDGAAVDSYMHVAGRVGRFGRGGKVISVVPAPYVVVLKNGHRKKVDEPRLMWTMFKKMNIKPVRFEHFD